MGRGIQGAILTAMGARLHTASVTATSWITPHVRAVDFHCPGLLDGQERPGAYVRGWFPDLENPARLHQRGYTLLQPDAEAQTFRLAFLIHHPTGPASRWATECQVGDRIGIQTLASEKGYDLGAHPGPGYLLVGDAAAWPALISIVAEIPDETPVRVIMEVFREEDRLLPFPDHPRLDLVWAPTRPDSRTLVEAISHDDYQGWQTWVTAESRATRLARSALELDHGQNRGTMHTQAYWVAGREMGRQITVEAVDQQEKHQSDQATDTEPVKRTLTPGTAPPTGPTETVTDVLAPARTPMILAGVIQALLSLLQLAPLLLAAELARRLAGGAGRAELQSLAVVAVVFLLVGVIGTSVFTAVLHGYDARFAAALRRRILDKLTRLPLGWFTTREYSDVTRLLKNDVTGLHYLVTHAVPDLVGAIVTPVALLVYLMVVDWRLGLVLLIPVIVYLVVMIRLAAGDRERMSRSLRYSAIMPGLTDRFLTGQPEARIFGDGAVVDLPGDLRKAHRFAAEWQADTIGIKTAMIRLVRPVTTVVLLSVAGTALVALQWLSAVDLIVFLVLGTSFGDRLLSMSYALYGLREGLQARADLHLLLSTPEICRLDPDQTHSTPATTTTPGPASMQMRGVTFGYSPGRTVVEDIDLDLVPGGVTALVGPSGSGKSTLAALMARLWDPDSGQVLFDGVDIRTLDEPDLRHRLAAVLQDAQLLRGTLRENLVLGQPQVAEQRLAQVIAAVHLQEVVDALPDGLDTPVDRDTLSGGQRQRVAIARALLREPEVVLLDEATAAADPDSEWEIQQGLRRLLAGRTVLMVSHRLHTVVEADQIVVLDRGRIVDRGTHQQLVAKGGLYARLWTEAEEAVR